MTREEWRRVKDIAAAVLAEDRPNRAPVIDALCGSDSALRAEVESLLGSVEASEKLFESPTLLIAGAGAALETLHGFETSRIGERIGAYRLLSELGGGGMGTAYLAERADEEFEKRVAIKLIKRGMDTDAVLRRFRHERQILANLDHPNIARLLDGGTTNDGLPYFVMEYVEGEPIDVYCQRRRLTVTERLKLFALVCDAVQHAHDHRVVHRDLKPGNILVSADGAPKLLDFGISKLLTPDDPSVTGEQTLLARAMTPLYASPEQIRGETVTAASDVYSLGVLLYELLTGQRPYQLDGHTLREIEEIICSSTPDKPRLSSDLDTIVLMALRKEPERRYASVAALAGDIRRYLDGQPVQARSDELGYRVAKFATRHRRRLIEAALLALLAVVALGPWWSRGSTPPNANARTDALAVLPFAIPPGGTDLEYIADGLTEGLIDALSRTPGLKVAARSTVVPLKAKPQDPRQVGRELKVQAVLLGSVAIAGADMSLGVELVDASDGHRVWAGTYASDIRELASVRATIVRDVSERLGLPASNAAAVAPRQTANGEAYQLYLKGRYLWNKRTEEGFMQALDYFQQALQKDPQYGLAYSGIADCYNLLVIWGTLSPNEAMPKVKEAAVKALTLDDSIAEAHNSLAFVNWTYDWDWTAAASEFERALALNPNYGTALDWYAYYLASRKRFDEAVSHITRAQALEPVSLSISTDVGEIYYWAGRYEMAVQQLRGVLQVEPTFAMAHNILGLTYLKMGRLNEGVAELEAAERLASGPRLLSWLGYGYGVAGAKDKAMATLRRLNGLSTKRYTSAFATAIIYTGLGDRTEAMKHLEDAFQERSDTMAILGVYPPLDGLRGEPRFQSLLARVGAPLD
jgi:serine/threonine protein kinase/TolB-like protein/Tfp pilus assembly protein PilF